MGIQHYPGNPPSPQKHNWLGVNWTNLVAQITVAGLLLGFIYAVWYTDIVPPNISTKFLGQILFSAVGVLFVLALIILNREKKVNK